MIFTTFPDLTVPSPQRAAFFSAYGKTHLVINAVDDGVFYERHPTPLTVKWVRSGRETYFLDGREVTVVPGNYLVINAGTEYGSEIARGTRTSSFSAFFEPGAARDVAAMLHAPEERLLAELSPPAPDAFFERLEPDHGRVGALLADVATRTRAGTVDSVALDEALRELLEALLRNQDRATRELEALPYVRPSTRAEVHARVSRARDRIEADYAAPLRLKDLARDAHLAPTHLLRRFKDVFGVTPAQALAQRRLRAAVSLLTRTELPVSAIAARVGFEDHSAFTRSFRRRYGRSPREVRKTGTAGAAPRG